MVKTEGKKHSFLKEEIDVDRIKSHTTCLAHHAEAKEAGFWSRGESFPSWGSWTQWFRPRAKGGHPWKLLVARAKDCLPVPLLTFGCVIPWSCPLSLLHQCLKPALQGLCGLQALYVSTVPTAYPYMGWLGPQSWLGAKTRLTCHVVKTRTDASSMGMILWTSLVSLIWDDFPTPALPLLSSCCSGPSLNMTHSSTLARRRPGLLAAPHQAHGHISHLAWQPHHHALELGLEVEVVSLSREEIYKKKYWHRNKKTHNEHSKMVRAV